MPSVLNLDDMRSLQKAEQKEANKDVFGALNGLIGVSELQAQRSAVRRAAFEEDAARLDGQQLAARTAGRLIGEAFARMGSDAKMDRAKAVDDAIATAEESTGFRVPQEAAADMKQQVSAQAGQESQQAATQQTEGSGASNLFDQEFTLVSNTMRELVKRGMTNEASSLLPKLKAIEQARADEMMEQAQFSGTLKDNIKKDQAIKDFKSGKPTTIVPRGGDQALEAQVFHDGRAYYFDPETQKEIWLRPGEYVSGEIRGTKESFGNKIKKVAVERSQAMTTAFSVMTDLRREVILNPDALTVAGDAFSMMNNLMGDFKRFRAENWIGRADLLAENDSDFESAMERAGVTNALQKGAIQRLAYAVAAARESGKLSESDVILAMQVFGIDQRDPEVRLSLLDSQAAEMLVALETFGSIDGFSSNPIYNRALTFADAFEQERKKRPSRRLGEERAEGGDSDINTDDADVLFEDKARGIRIR